METNIFNKHNTFGLKIIGAWPGISRLWVFFVILIWAAILLFFAFWDLVVVYDDLEAFSDNLVSTIGSITCLSKLISLRLERK